MAAWKPVYPLARVRNPDSMQIPLHWMRLARLVDDGVVELIESLGSGDLVSLGKSSGFVELPPAASGEGPWPYVAWA
jgi:molybdopterin molybdotransferase